jgi:putative membrane protein
MVPADYTMTYLILRIMINALAIAVAVKVVDGIVFSGEWWKMIFVGAVFGIVNSFLKPLLTFFTLPLIILSLGLFTLIVNTLMLLITVSLSGPLNLGLQIHGFWPAFKGALIISIVSMVLSWLTGMKKIKYYRSR